MADHHAGRVICECGGTLAPCRKCGFPVCDRCPHERGVGRLPCAREPCLCPASAMVQAFLAGEFDDADRALTFIGKMVVAVDLHAAIAIELPGGDGELIVADDLDFRFRSAAGFSANTGGHLG